MQLAHFLIFSIVILLRAATNGVVVIADCKDNDFNAYCQCLYEETRDFLEMRCKSILDASLNKLPLYSVSIVRVINSYSHWPTISEEYQFTLSLILSENQIESIGDLTNLENLQFLNLSHNHINKIDKSLSTLKMLNQIDLSYNRLEEIRFEDLVIDCHKDAFSPNTDQIFSNLEFLFLIGNRIKQIYNFDLVFVGMPMLKVILMNSNMLTSIEVTDLSQQSLNVIKKANQALEINATYMQFISTDNQTGYFYGFNANPISHVHFNFEAIFNEIFTPFKVSFLKRFLAISVESVREKVICDCNIYTDLMFLIEQLGDTITNKKIYIGPLEDFVCHKKESGSAVSLFFMINQKTVKKTDFCDSATETSTSSKSSTISRATKSTETKSTVNTDNLASPLSPSLFVKMTSAISLFYSLLLT